MLSKEQLKKMHNYIYYIYSKQLTIEFNEKAAIDDFCSYIGKRIIVLPKKIIGQPSEWSLFAFLHEIGHVLTNSQTMKRCEQEYLATKWAIEEAKRIGFQVPDKYISIYQGYIYRWRERSIKLNGKNIPTETELSLFQRR